MDGDASQRKHVRGKNWSAVEDETLCEAWLDVSQDPIVSMDQKVDTFYERIMESFTSISKEKSHLIDSDSRTPTSLKARWGTIQRSVNKFCGFYAQARQRKRSGTNLSDQLNEALVLYKSDQKVHFQLMHAFKILENAPKWKATMCQKENRVPKRKVPDLEECDSGSDESTPSQSSSTQISANGETPGSSAQIRPTGRKAAKVDVRPTGRKAAKVDDDILKNSTSLADSGRYLAETAKFKVKDNEERTKALVRMANHAIMSVNPQNLPPMAREYYELEQARILNEMKEATSE